MIMRIFTFVLHVSSYEPSEEQTRSFLKELCKGSRGHILTLITARADITHITQTC